MNPTETFVNPADGSSHSGEVVDRVNGYSVIECAACGFKHVIPIPGAEALGDLYEESFYVNEKPTYFEDVERDREWYELTYRQYYGMFEKHLPSGRRRLLEVGSGPGYFLKCGRERGWDVLGFEPSRQAFAYARQLGVRVVNAFFRGGESSRYGRFDVVYMNDVLEHVADPIGLLAGALEMLDNDGLLCVVSPNDYNPLQVTLRDGLGFAPWWVSPPQHLNYFDFRSMSGLLERLGTRVVDATCTFPMEFFLLSGENYVGNDALGKQCHARRKALEKNMYSHNAGLYAAVGRSLASLGIGREFVVVARKGTE